jgi:hypothetical protein
MTAGGPGGLRIEVSGTADAIEQVPEPGSLFLLGGGAVLLFIGKMRHQRRTRTPARNE